MPYTYIRPDRAPLMLPSHVLPQDVSAEITVRVTPYGVDVIRLVLRVIVLHEERRPVQSVVVRSPSALIARPGEVHAVDACPLDLASLYLCPAAPAAARRTRR